MIDGTKAQRRKLYIEAAKPEYKYVIMNYELLLHDFDEMKDLAIKKDVQLLIADEAHKIVNHKGKRNNALAKLVQEKKSPKYKGIKHVFYLTATPMSSKIEQLFGVFQIRRPDFFGKFSEFAKKHLKLSFNGRQQEIVGYLNLDEIREKTVNYMLRRTENEIDMELPDMFEKPEWIEMTSLQKKLDILATNELEQLSNEMNAARNNEAKFKMLSDMMKAMMYVRKAIADHPQLLAMSNSKMIQEKFGSAVMGHKEAGKSPKLDELMELIDEMVIEGGEKLIVFSEFETMTRILYDEINKVLSKKGLKAVTYTGKHDTKTKDAIAQEFETNPDCRIFIATDAAAEGLNLQFCPYMVNYDLPWNPDVWDQRKGRIRRGGSPFEKVKVIDLLAQDSIDRAIWDGLHSKLNLFNYLVENTEEESAELRRVMYGKE